MTVPAYMGLPSQALTIAYRFGLPILWGGLALAATTNTRLAPARSCTAESVRCLLGVRPDLHRRGAAARMAWFSSTTAQGAAVAKALGP